jgi:hypothetical protein
MQLGELFKLVRRAEPQASRHRDHICSEAARHDFAHCPKPLASVYAWRRAAEASGRTMRCEKLLRP